MLKKFLFIVLCLSFWFFPASYAQEKRSLEIKPKLKQDIPKKPTYRALLIGNNKYQQFPSLKTAVRDVEKIFEILTTLYGFKANNIKLLKNATRTEMMEGFEYLKETSNPSDSILIYYGGHGVYDESGLGFWVPVDGKENSTADYISNDAVLGRLRTIDVRHKLLVSDSCFSGSLLRGVKNLASNINPRDYFLQKSALKSAQGIASGGNEPVSDGGPMWGGHSIFAYHFIG
ncbi:MAG: caspase family protein, partial [SAR324 cluster bacterium]|nr:caspase family protein [SAR324 cluster bacterium]